MGCTTRYTMNVFVAGIFLLFFMESLPAAADKENMNREARYIQILKSGASIQRKTKLAGNSRSLELPPVSRHWRLY